MILKNGIGDRGNDKLRNHDEPKHPHSTTVILTLTTTEASLPLPAKKAGVSDTASQPISAMEPTFDPAESVPSNLIGFHDARPLPPVKLDGNGRMLGWSHKVALASKTQFGKGRPSAPITSWPLTR